MCGAVIIPGLPNEVSLGILARLPRILQARLCLVCHSWKAALEPASLNTLRKSLGISEVWPVFADQFMGMDKNKRVFSVFVSPVPHIFSHDASLTHRPLPLQEIGILPPSQLWQHLGWFEFEVFAAVGSKVLLAALPLDESVDHLQGIYVFDAGSMRWIDCVFPFHHTRPYNSSEKVVDAEGGYVYVASGNRSIKHLDRLDCWRGIWETIPSPHVERTCAAVVVLHGYLHVIGGVLSVYVPGRARHPCYSGEVWDPSTREWTIRPELWPAEVFKDEMTTRAAVVKDQLFALRGGFPKEELMRYQPLSEKWVSLGILPADVHEDARLCDYNLLAIGEELWVFDDCTACLAAVPGIVPQPLVWRVLSSTSQEAFQDYDPLTYIGVLLV